ncbi:MAG: DrmB family protein [Streptosporangiaceae bacterium]
MPPAAQHRRRVGTVRPSHLMFTGGVGALIDLPNFPVLVRGLDEWRYDTVPEWEPLAEPRLLAAVGKLLDAPVAQLRPPPWLDGFDADPNGQPGRVGVPVTPFPQWLRCSACNLLASLDAGIWGFTNDKARRPDEAKFFHQDCPRKKKKPLAVAARFVLACRMGHLDDFPYIAFVHHGGACPEVSHPRLRMADYGGNQVANVEIKCLNCGAKRNISRAMGRRGEETLPACRGRHPHLGTFEPCQALPMVLVVGASNQWFAQTLSALAVPATGASALQAKVAQLWENLQNVTLPAVLDAFWAMPQFQVLHQWTKEEVLEAIAQHKKELEAGPDQEPGGYPDLRTPEWEVFTAAVPPEPNDDFTLRRDPEGVPAPLTGFLSDVVQAERLREVRALAGFTRLDAPDPEDPDLVQRAPLSRDKPTWVPASEVRGEGIFLRLDDQLMTRWEERVRDSDVVREHRDAFARFRSNRYSDRLQEPDFDPMRGWPEARFIALHTLSHLLIRAIALECGYSSASLSERIYSSPDRAGILIYTAVPDAEGTLGGLVSLAEPGPLVHLMQRALRDASRCSSDPLCAERLPKAPADFLHGAACHACLFVSETTCERGNRFLDRRFIVPVDDPSLVLIPDIS